MIKKIFPILVVFISINIATAQPDINYLDRVSYFKISAGGLMPGENFSSTEANGLFAENGYQIGLDYNYMIAYGFGLGLNLEFDQFRFNGDEFFKYTNAETMKAQKHYSSTKFGLNVLFNVPVKLGSDDWALNFYAEGNAGIRTMNMPDIDLTYNEIANKYVEVTYRSRSNTMGYLGYSGGLKFLFLEKFGVNLSYNALLKSRHSIKYSVRMFDAADELYEEENYAHDYLDHTGFQIGFLFLFGR